jgi:ribosomal protein S13
VISKVTKQPLFDAVPVQNYIVSVLHIIIGMGNTMTDGIIEWLESRVEKLQKAEIEAHNRIIHATIQLEEDKKTRGMA